MRKLIFIAFNMQADHGPRGVSAIPLPLFFLSQTAHFLRNWGNCSWGLGLEALATALGLFVSRFSSRIS